MSRQQKHPPTPANVIAFENAQRQKRIDALDRLAKQAWAVRDEDAMIRFRYEWLAVQAAMEKSIEYLRDYVLESFASDRQWEETLEETRRKKYEAEQRWQHDLYEQEGG